MTRGLTPPSTLTSEDVMALAQVRKDIWVNAAQGFLLGGSSSYLLHRAAKLAQDKQWIKILPTLSRNTAFASVMVGASLGSFVFATTTGKNSVHTLHPIFSRGARPQAVPADDHDKNVTYQDAQYRAQAHEDLRDIKNRSLSLARTRTHVREQLVDDEEKTGRVELERNRVMRRASLTRNFQAGHGLNDSHGGHWVPEDQFRKD